MKLTMKKLTCLSLVFLYFSVSALDLSQTSALGKSVQSVDWRKLLSASCESRGFQDEVRKFFPSLKPDAQQRITACIGAMRNSERFAPTGTPLDALIVKSLSAAIAPLVTDNAGKAELTQITEAGDLNALLGALQGQSSTSPIIDEVAGQDGKKALFVNSTWVTEAKTLFKFFPKGKGTQLKGGKETTFEWRSAGGIVTADFGKNRFIYFKFAPNESFFGVLRGQINQPLTKQ